jgi:REP element-mobilizing transposase RayT
VKSSGEVGYDESPCKACNQPKGELIMTQRFKWLSHPLYECKYHIVFCPKYRYRILKEAIGEYVRQQVYQLCQQKEEIEVLVMNIQPDHVHLVVSIPSKYAVSAFMGYLKGKLALRLFQQYWMKKRSVNMFIGKRPKKSRPR